MEDDVISLFEAKGQMHRLKAKSTQWRKTGYKDGWNDAIESAYHALDNCKPVRCEHCPQAGQKDESL